MEKKKDICSIIAIYFTLFLLSGCSPQFNSEGLNTLSRLSKNRAGMDAYMHSQAEGYSRLLRDYENSALEKGFSKDAVVSRYGDPVYCRVLGEGSNERCLYGYPSEYFSSSKVYLTFDNEGRLISWVKEGG